MEPIEYVLAVRRRWFVVLLTMVAGLIAGYLSAVLVVNTPTALIFTATTVMATDSPASGGDPPSLSRLTLLLTTDPVPARVAESVHFHGDPAVLASKIVVTPHGITGTMDITATAGKPERAAEIANAFGTELARYADEQAANRQSQALDRAKEQRDSLKKRIDGLDAEMTAALAAGRKDTDTQLLQQQQQATVRQYGFADQRVTQLEATPPDTSGVSMLVAARSKAAGGGQKSVVPVGKKPRLAIGGLVGLLAGVALALLLDRFKPRVTTRSGAERAFGLAVLAEIPSLASPTAAGLLVVVNEPASPEAEAHRMLRTALVMASHQSTPVPTDADAHPDSPGPVGEAEATGPSPGAPADQRAGALDVVVLTAAGPGEGTTVTAANLAASFAETGSTVVVVGYDLRHPRLHEVFGMSAVPGISEHLSGHAIQDVVRPTPVPGVSLLAAGSRTADLGRAARGAADVIAAARRMADIVIVDTPPLLLADEASRLIPHASSVLIVARDEVTVPASAAAAAALLGRLGAPTVGVALITTTTSRRTTRRYFKVADRGAAV